MSEEIKRARESWEKSTLAKATARSPERRKKFATTSDIELQPVYEEVTGWMTSTVGAKNESDLPAKARRYLERVEELTGVPFCLISTGPQRDETILCEDSPLLRWFPSVRSSIM